MTWTTARRVLCVRLDTLGDVLMTGPAMRALRAGRELTLLTSAAGARAAELMPEVDEVVVYEAPWMKPERGSEPEPDRAMVERMRVGDYDAAVIFTVFSQSPLPAALLCHLAGIPLRLAHCRENPYGLLTQWVREQEPERGVRHEVRRQLDLVASVGARTDDERLRVEVPSHARDGVAAILAERDRPWVVVHPGASAESRRYPAERWARVCTVLAEEHGIEPLLTGGAGEAELAHSIRERARTGVVLAGRLDLAELAALLEAAPLLLSGNTGPVHVAAAVGTPVVDVYALTNPQHTPWGVPNRVLSHDVPCRWCYKSVCPEGHHACLRMVSSDDVVSAALELMPERVTATA
jgi:lipopolysaccharide heptosyltransferase II